MPDKHSDTDEVRDQLRALPKTTKFDFRYPIDAYEDDLVKLITSEKRKLLERLKTEAGSRAEYYQDKKIFEERVVSISAIDTELASLEQLGEL